MVVRVFIRLIVSTIGALIPLLFFSGSSFSPLGGIAPNIFGSESSALTSLLGTASISPIAPFGAAGLTGIVVWLFLQRVFQQVQMATYSTPKMKGMNPEAIMKSMQSSMPWMTGQAAASIPIALPADLTKSQLLVLKTCRQGHSKSKDLAKALSMDRKEVDKELFSLQTNGYLTKSNKLTSKALGVLEN